MKILNKIKSLSEKISTKTNRNINLSHGSQTAWVTVKVIRTDGSTELLCQNKHNLHTNGGIDYTHYQCYTSNGTGSTSDINTATIGSNYLALTTNGTAPSASDTTLTSEISTNGLQRAQCSTRTHTASTNVTTLSNTFTSTGTFTAVQKGAIFNASSSGVMNHEFTFASTNLNNGDQIQITITITGG